MSDAHSADADYTAAHFPTNDELDTMIEGAVALANVLNAEQGRRQPFDAPRVARWPVPESVRASSWRAPLRPVDRPLPDDVGADLANRMDAEHRTARFTAAMATAREQPRRVSHDQAIRVETHAEEIASEVKALRALSVDDPVFGHALASIDLGLVGLARVVGSAAPSPVGTEGDRP